MNDLSLYRRLSRLSLEQRRSLVEQLQPHQSTGSNSNEQLTAFVTATTQINQTELRDHLKRCLPDYMIPVNIIQLDHLPKLPNGKVDRNALFSYQHQVTETPGKNGEVRNDLESKLIGIWEEVLGMSPIGVNDNFFEIGGDSILSIQIVAQARNAGISLAPNQLFEHQTIAMLAREVNHSAPGPISKSDQSGPVPLTPIQQWFFQQHQQAPYFWNQGVRISLFSEITPDMIRTAATRLVSRHDALRLSFYNSNGQWQAEVKDVDDIDYFRHYDLRDQAVEEQKRRISEQLISIQQEVKLEDGGLFKCLYFQCGANQQDLLIILAHHLVIDAVSWQILLEELKHILVRIIDGENDWLPADSGSFVAWSRYLQEHISSEKVQQDISFWEAQKVSEVKFPVDFQVNLPVYEQTIDTLTHTFLLSDLEVALENTKSSKSQIIEALLVAALVQTLTSWTKSPELLLGLERHGRVSDLRDFDLSRFIGWFTTYFPLRFAPDEKDQPEIVLNSVMAQLQSVPRSGLSYGLLRYSGRMNTLDQRPPVVFNFLGKQEGFNSDIPGPVEQLKENTRHLLSERDYYLEVNSVLMEGEVVTQWRYSRDQYRQSTIERLINEFDNYLRDLITTYKANGKSYSTLEFPEADISQDDLNNLLDQL